MSVETGSKVLSYVITLDDLASPGLRAFRDQVVATNKAAQDSLASLKASTTETAAAMGKLTVAETDAAKSGETFAVAQGKTATSSKGAAAEVAALSASHGQTTGAVKASSVAHAEHSNVLTSLSGKLGTASSKTKEYGAALSALSVPILAIGGASVYASLKFGAAMEMLHTQAGYSQKAVDQLSASVLKLAGPLAQTPDAIADGLYHIASVGIPASKAIEIVTAAAEGANISGANFNDTANLLATTLKNWPNIMGGASGAMGVLDAIVGKGNFHMEELALNLGKVVPVAKAVGVTLPELGSAIDVLTSHGVQLSQATTSLRFGLSLIEKPSSTADAALQQLGMTHEQLAEDLRKPDGLLVALQDLKTHLDEAYPANASMAQKTAELQKYSAELKATGASAATYKTDMTKFYDQLTSGAGSQVLQAQATLSVFGGTRGSTAILPLLQNLPDLSKTYKEIPQGKTAIDQLNQSVAAWDKTQQAQLDHLKAGLEATGAVIGKDVGPIVIPLLKDIATDVEDIVGAFDKLSPSARKAMLEVVGGLALAGPALKILSPVLKVGQGVTSLGGKAISALRGGGVSSVEQDLADSHAAGGIYGMTGAVMPGSRMNPIAVQMVGEMLGTADEAEADTATESNVASTAAKDTEKFVPSVIGFSSATSAAAVAAPYAIPLLIAGLLSTNYKSQATAAATSLTGSAASGQKLAISTGAYLGGEGMHGVDPWTPDDIALINEANKALANVGMTGAAAAIAEVTKQADALKQEWPTNISEIDSIVKQFNQDLPGGAATAGHAFLSLATSIEQGMASGKISLQSGLADMLALVQKNNADGTLSYKQSEQDVAAILAMPDAQAALKGSLGQMVVQIQNEMAAGKLSFQQGTADIEKLLGGIKSKTVTVTMDAKVNTQSIATARQAIQNALNGSGGGNLNLGGSPFAPAGPSTGAVSSVTRWSSEVEKAAAKYGIPASVLLADIQQESGGKPLDVSPAGAFGLTQFMPSTAISYGVSQGSSTAATNSQIMGQAAYLASGVQQYGSIMAALEDYYGGPKGVADPNESVSGGPTPAQYAAQVLGKTGAYSRYDTKTAGPITTRPKTTAPSPRYAAGGISKSDTGAQGGSSLSDEFNKLIGSTAGITSLHWNPLANNGQGAYQQMTTTQYDQVKQAYYTSLQNAGQPLTPIPTSPGSEKWDPLTNSYKKLTTSQYSSIANQWYDTHSDQKIPTGPVATAYHFDYRSGTRQLMTAAEYKQLQQAWQASPLSQGGRVAMPSSELGLGKVVNPGGKGSLSWQQLSGSPSEIAAASKTMIPENIPINIPGIGDLTSITKSVSVGQLPNIGSYKIGTDMRELSDTLWTTIDSAILKQIKSQPIATQITDVAAISTDAKRSHSTRVRELASQSITGAATAVKSAVSSAPTALAGSIDNQSLSQLQSLITDARKSGNKNLVTGLLSDMESTTKAWDTAIKSNFTTALSNVTLAEQLSVNQQELGISPTAKATISKSGAITFGKVTAAPNPAATSATDPAYLAAQIAAYTNYDAGLEAELAKDQSIAKQAKKNGNTKLLATTQSDIQTIQDALEQSKVDVSGLQVAYQQAVYAAFLTTIQNTTTALAASSTQMASGQSILSDVGDVNQTSLAALQTLSSQQGGLTGPQIAQANANMAQYTTQEQTQANPLVGTGLAPSVGVAGGAAQSFLAAVGQMLTSNGGNFGTSQLQYIAQNVTSGSEAGVDVNALLSGQLSPTDAASVMQDLITALQNTAALGSAIEQNTTATNTLTGATLAQTVTMASFGGTVTFTEPGTVVPFVAGQSSVQTNYLGVGM